MITPISEALENISILHYYIWKTAQFQLRGMNIHSKIHCFNIRIVRIQKENVSQVKYFAQMFVFFIEFIAWYLFGEI